MSDILDSTNVEKEFLEETKLDRYSMKIPNGEVCLSRRETECMLHFANGKTAKETARLLGISPRTVESYVDNIRAKTSYRTKAELVKAFTESAAKRI